MTVYWEPGTWYNYSDIVEYEGARYEVLVPHWSQSNWTPPIVPYLWGRIVTPFQGGYYGGQRAQQPNDSYQRPDQYAEAPQEEHEKNGLDEHMSHRNWTPPKVPDPWGRIQGSECQRQEPCNPPPFQGGYYGGQRAHQPNNSYRRPGQYAEAPQEEHKKNWLGEHESHRNWTPPKVPDPSGRIQGSECQSYQRPDQYAEAPPEEHKKNWLDEHKKEIGGGIGGGVLAAAAAVYYSVRR